METSFDSPYIPSNNIERLYQQQKRELAIVNAIIQTVSSSYHLKDTLEAALEIVLGVVGSSTGWICLVGEDKSCSSFVGYKGICIGNEQQGPMPCLVQCVCSRVHSTGDVVVVRQLSKGCPLLFMDDTQTQRVIGHVSVPLMVKARIVGQLNVAFGDTRQADQMDVDLLKTIGPQLAVAVENARLWEEVQNKEELRKELLKKLVAAQEDERRRISRELHDELGQQLTSMLVRLQVLENKEMGQPTGEVCVGLKNTVTQLLTSIHDLSLELRPTALDDLGLVPALQQYARNCPERLGIEVDFEPVGMDGRRLPRELETTLYRTIQESLTNVARHAQARKASVLLKMDRGHVSVIIEDNGVGFDLNDIRAGYGKKDRLGLYGMEERVSLVGGSLTIESVPGAGTTIYMDIPVDTAA